MCLRQHVTMHRLYIRPIRLPEFYDLPFMLICRWHIATSMHQQRNVLHTQIQVNTLSRSLSPFSISFFFHFRPVLLHILHDIAPSYNNESFLSIIPPNRQF